MKIVCIAVLMTLSTTVFAQDNGERGKFVRVFDINGKKIAKGHIEQMGEGELTVASKKMTLKLPVNNIGFIRTGRASGHNVAIGAGAGFTVGAILGVAAVSEDDGLLGVNSDAENIVSFGVLGAMAGTLAGGLTIPFKKSRKYNINGETEKWQQFKNALGPKYPIPN